MLPRSLQGIIHALYRLLTPAVFLSLWLAVTPAWAGSMLLLGAGGAGATGAAYTGPGDVQPGAAAWWGLRGYTAAYAAPGTNPAADICDAATGLTCTTINILSNGSFDTSTASTFCTAHTNCIVKKLYDQTGNGCPLISSATSFPALNFSPGGLGAGLPALSFNGTSQQITTNTCGAIASPWSISVVYNETSLPGNTIFIGDTSGNGLGSTSSNTVDVNLNFAATATFSTWHCVQGVDKGGSVSGLTVDGTQTSGAGTTASLTATAELASAFSFFAGFMTEGGRWSGDKTSTSVALRANQHTYWGF